MTQKEVLQGEKDWLGSLGSYNGTSFGADISDFRALDAAIRDSQIQKIPVTHASWTAEEKLNSFFGLTQRNLSSSNQEPEENYGQRFGQGLLGALR